MIGTAVQVFLPGPVVFEWNQLVKVSATVDHALIVNRYPIGCAFQFFQACTDVKFGKIVLCFLQRIGIARAVGSVQLRGYARGRDYFSLSGRHSLCNCRCRGLRCLLCCKVCGLSCLRG